MHSGKLKEYAELGIIMIDLLRHIGDPHSRFFHAHYYCAFCSAKYPEHEDRCVWVKADTWKREVFEKAAKDDKK